MKNNISDAELQILVKDCIKSIDDISTMAQVLAEDMTKLISHIDDSDRLDYAIGARMHSIKSGIESVKALVTNEVVRYIFEIDTTPYLCIC